VIDAQVAKLSEQLAQAVAEGKITQEQADKILVKYPEMLEEALHADWSEGAGQAHEHSCTGEEDG
jgi:hypothetical protein